MNKRIVLLPKDPALKPAQQAEDGPWEPGKERRSRPRRSALPRRIELDRRSRSRYHAPHEVERRDGGRRSFADRRRRRDRRFGLDPTLYDRLADLDL